MNKMRVTVPDERHRDSETDSSVKKGKEIAVIKRKTRPSLNSLAILKEAGQSIDTSSPDKLCDQLHAGVFLKPNKLKYFVDKVLNKNGFVLFAKEIFISGEDNPKYWQWNQDKDISGEKIEVAQLLHMSWLEVKGTIWTVDLSPETLYEIVFVIKKIIGGNISKFSVKLTMTCPNKESNKRYESLEDKPFDEWIEIWVDDFRMSPEMVGHLKFSLDATDQLWKHGLVMKCAIIRPKN